MSGTANAEPVHALRLLNEERQPGSGRRRSNGLATASDMSWSKSAMESPSARASDAYRNTVDTLSSVNSTS